MCSPFLMEIWVWHVNYHPCLTSQQCMRICAHPSMELKLSSLSNKLSYFLLITLYAEHVRSKWCSLHTFHIFIFGRWCHNATLNLACVNKFEVRICFGNLTVHCGQWRVITCNLNSKFGIWASWLEGSCMWRSKHVLAMWGHIYS